MERPFPAAASDQLQPLEIADVDVNADGIHFHDDCDEFDHSYRDGESSEHDSASQESFSDELELVVTGRHAAPRTIINTNNHAKTTLGQARRLLYVSRGVYHASELAWQFASSLWMAALGENRASLFWVSAYQATARMLILGLVPTLSSQIDAAAAAAAANSAAPAHSNKNKTRRSSNHPDHSNRRSKLVSTWIVGQHACVMITILLVWGTLRLQQSDAENQQQDPQQQQHLANVSKMGLVLICLCGGLAEVLHNVLEVAINRDWIVVMAEQAEKGFLPTEEAAAVDSTGSTMTATPNITSNITATSASTSASWLKDTNVRLRQIYLVCEILSPWLTGALLSLPGTASLWVVFGLKGISMLVVGASMQHLCRWVPALQQQHQQQQHQEEQSEVTQAQLLSKSETEAPLECDRIEEFRSSEEEDCASSSSSVEAFSDANRHRQKQPGWMRSCGGGGGCSDLRIYLSQEGLVGAGLGLAFLYANVLTFGGMMCAYLAEEGNLSLASIGLWKGVSNIASVVGTLCFSWSKHSLRTKALWSLVVMVVFLSVSMIGIWWDQHQDDSNGNGGDSSITNDRIDDNRSLALPLGSVLVIAGVIPSRMGLWGYDLSVTQLYQNHVHDSLRGTVGGTQTILNNAMEFLPFVLTMVVSNVQDFWIIMVVGYASVAMALLTYAMGTYGCSCHSSFSNQTGLYGRVQEEDRVVAPSVSNLSNPKPILFKRREH